MNKKEKNAIDKLINDIKNQESFVEISDYLKECIEKENELKGEYSFYSGIQKALIDGDENISYEEKLHFIAIHKGLLDMFTFC